MQGTYHFFAPEALHGSQFNAYGADVWALGVTLYSLATGALPFVSQASDGDGGADGGHGAGSVTGLFEAIKASVRKRD